MNHWILKTEPTTYSWDNLLRDKTTAWTGVRNFQARNNLQAMTKGDLCLIYHSGKEKSLIGIAKVIKNAYPDPTSNEGNWVCVDLEAVQTLDKKITLSTIKTHPLLQNILMIRHSRLSVSPITIHDYETILALSSTVMHKPKYDQVPL